jgi:DMSO/TMAO reductase YedYZ molybdopterin-dependent catalytic subunit
VLDRITRRNERRRLEEEAEAQGRIPPGQSLTVKWPVLSAGPVPRFDPQTWRFRIFGLVDQPVSFTWEEFRALPWETRTNDIHCVTRWSKLDNVWEGVPVRDVLARAEVDPRARYALVHAPGYAANLSLADLMEPDAIFAFTHNGAPLEPEHGGPVRLVVPKLYFWKSVKWVNGLELFEQDEPGFWEVRGYHMHGDPWTEERFGSYW